MLGFELIDSKNSRIFKKHFKYEVFLTFTFSSCNIAKFEAKNKEKHILQLLNKLQHWCNLKYKKKSLLSKPSLSSQPATIIKCVLKMSKNNFFFSYHIPCFYVPCSVLAFYIFST